MNLYKFLNKDGTAVLKYPGTTIVEGGYGWQDYVDYVAAGGQTDPWKTPEELLTMERNDKLAELGVEHDRLVDIAVGTSSPRKKDKTIARTIKLLRRETKETITPAELAELNAMEAMDDHLDLLVDEYDAVEQWLEDPARSIEEIQGYDVAVDPGWSVMA
jgi:hypothetical protein